MTVKRKPLPASAALKAAVLVLHRRVAKLERMHAAKRIGFETECLGDRVEQDPEDAEIIPEETRGGP